MADFHENDHVKEAIKFIEDLGNKISKINGDNRSKSYLFQSLSIAVQRGNGACVMGTTSSTDILEDLAYLWCFLTLFKSNNLQFNDAPIAHWYPRFLVSIQHIVPVIYKPIIKLVPTNAKTIILTFWLQKPGRKLKKELFFLSLLNSRYVYS